MAKNIMRMNRGDTFPFTAVIEDPKAPNSFYRLGSTDILYFAILPPHSRFEDAEKDGGIIRYFLAEDQKDSGSFEIVLNAKDTKDLHSGVYYYCLKLQKLPVDEYGESFKDNLEKIVGDFALGEIQTVVKRTKFIINE